SSGAIFSISRFLSAALTMRKVERRASSRAFIAAVMSVWICSVRLMQGIIAAGLGTKLNHTVHRGAQSGVNPPFRRPSIRIRPPYAILAATPDFNWTHSNAAQESSLHSWTNADPSRGANCNGFIRHAPRSEEHTSELQSRGHLVC